MTRQPSSAASRPESGAKTVLASPPTRVSPTGIAAAALASKPQLKPVMIAITVQPVRATSVGRVAGTV
ncbi:hypothetical protein [Kribbella solani]|uniref:Uncharacterized protein n=1 Tax=Kribbella solani TaxID=236067 RepID=A0A841DMF6_9ACTN|nr:hypothetical protein [Kribbella solani]MBB5980304.1 hypothetical protein [Kribbella solani]